MTDPADGWLLTTEERDNPHARLPNLVRGNECTPLIHGADYFRRLAEVVGSTREGDYVFFTDWRGDPDELLTDDGPTVGELFCEAARRGAIVRGLVWRSHLDLFGMSEEENQTLDRELEGAGAEVILDQRVHRFGSHHQKLVVVRFPSTPERDVAFVGGIDLCHSRRDDAGHLGDRQVMAMAEAYGETPAWHDVQLEVNGPAVGAFETVFRERWEDPTNADSHNPLARIRDEIKHTRLDTSPLPAVLPDPPAAGRQTVQPLRTYPAIKPPLDYAPNGERSIARGYSKAILNATRLIYLEDQYMWSRDVALLLARALASNPRLHLVVVVPRVPDQEGALAVFPNRIGQLQALKVCRQASADRLHVFNLENPMGTPVYVHAKVCTVDDVWGSVGSDNMNRRSWTHDSELSAVVLDEEYDDREPSDPRGDGLGARRFPRDLRLRLAHEHLDLDADSDGAAGLVDPESFVAAFETSAERLDQWHANGRVAPRPPGRLRRHHPAPVNPLQRLWATPAYRLLHDPDGRPIRMRRAKQF